MKSLIFKLFFTLIGACFILIFALPWSYFNLDVPFSGSEYRLGLDLQGGIELDYKVDLTLAKQEEGYNAQRKDSILEGLKSIIDKRVESLNINDSIITSASYGGEEHIIVQIPLKGNDSLQNSENIERAKAAIGKVVKIEFKEARDQITLEDIEKRQELSREILLEIQDSGESFYSETLRYTNLYENIVSGMAPNIDILFTPTTGSGNISETLTDGKISEELIKTRNSDNEVGNLIVRKSGEGYEYLFISDEPSVWKVAVDEKGRVLDDRYFTKASVQYNEAFQAMIELTFNSQGAEVFGNLTKRLTGQPIAIFVGGELLTAPNVNEPILTGRAVITGNYTPESADRLATDINTGVVPAPIYLTSERTIDAKLGQDSLGKIIYAGFSGFVIILLFLAFVYRLSGIIAAVALFTYVAITLAFLKQFGVVLTLASIAGLVLSVGIAIDANILIFERIKDELRKGKSIVEAQREGFEKSFSAIWDANITGLIVAAILFIFGINLIKGFGFILGLGIMVSLFTVFFISRLFVRLLARSDVSEQAFIGKK